MPHDNINPECDKKWSLPDIFFIHLGVKGSYLWLYYDVELCRTGLAAVFLNIPDRDSPSIFYLTEMPGCISINVE
jgi:hypothetical protein